MYLFIYLCVFIYIFACIRCMGMCGYTSTYIHDLYMITTRISTCVWARGASSSLLTRPVSIKHAEIIYIGYTSNK